MHRKMLLFVVLELLFWTLVLLCLFVRLLGDWCLTSRQHSYSSFCDGLPMQGRNLVCMQRSRTINLINQQ